MSSGGEKLELKILAMITPNREVVGGGEPIIYAKSAEEAENLAREIARALHSDTVLLSNGVYLIVPDIK